VFENRVLRVICRPKRDEVTEVGENGMRSFTTSTLRQVKSERGSKRNAYRSLVVKPEGNRPLGRPRRT
jgi:hypothetical protein